MGKLRKDFTNLDAESIEDFALAVNKEVEHIVTVEVECADLMDKLRLLPANLSWFNTQYRILSDEYLTLNKQYKHEHGICFSKASEEAPGKSTIKAIEAKMYDMFGESLEVLEDEKDELEQKTKILKDAIDTISKTINVFQSMGKLYAVERESYK